MPFFPGFLYFWGVVFIITTTLVTIFKKEKNDPRSVDNESEQTVSEMYVLLWKVVRLPTVVSLGVILLTCKVRTVLSISRTLEVFISYLLKTCFNVCSEF